MSYILIVEDDSIILGIIEENVKKLSDTQLLSVSSAEAALKILDKNGEPSLVFSDYSLDEGGGDMNGFDFYQEFRIRFPNISSRFYLTTMGRLIQEAIAELGNQHFDKMKLQNEVFLGSILEKFNLLKGGIEVSQLSDSSL